jgi:hypothetical protein
MIKLRFIANKRVALCVSIAAVLLILPMRNVARVVGKTPSTATRHPSLQEAASKLYSAYWYMDQDTKSVLQITNHGNAGQTVSPTLLVRGTEQVSLDPIAIPAHGTRNIDLNKALKSRRNFAEGGGDRRWGDGSRIGSLWGSATLQCETVDGISSKILSEDPRESLAVHSGFYEYGSGSLSSMWWLPTKKSVALVVLQNGTYHETAVQTLLYLDGRAVPGPRLSLPAGASRLFDLRDLIPKSISKKLPQVGAIRFISEDESSSLFGRMVLFDEERGFSIPLKMHGLTAQLTGSLQLAGAPFGKPDKKMGFPKSARFTTQVLLTNTSQKSLDVTISLDGRSAEGAPVSSNLPAFAIPPLQSRVVDLDALRISSRSPLADGYAGVRLTHTGTGFDLLTEAITVDRTLNYSFDNALYDDELLSSVYHAISFDLTGNKDTFLLVKNPSNATIRFGYRLNYERQSVMHTYIAKLAELKPYELGVIDLRALRDSKVLDGDGRILPSDVEFGNATIFANQPIISGDPNFDSEAGISSSCINPCQGTGRERCAFGNCEECGPCDWHPELCQGGQCFDSCTPCLAARSAETVVCLRGLALCEGVVTAAFLASSQFCDSQDYCQEGEPGFNSAQCDECNNNALAAFIAAQAFCAVVFADCMNDRINCSNRTRADCTPCN